jgi:putative transposase
LYRRCMQRLHPIIHIMPDKFQNKYRIPSARASWWDYNKNGAYYVTICTAHRIHYFGDISWDSPTGPGKMAQKIWMEIPLHFSFVELDEFVIMPNHVHGIILIDRDSAVINPNSAKVDRDSAMIDRDSAMIVETLHATSLLYGYGNRNRNRYPKIKK